MPDDRAPTGRSRLTERLLILAALAVIAALFCFFLRDILIPFLRLELRRDVEGARELLLERGWLGFLTVALVEALQMVVIFIPAEFIQISSGLSYPFPVALLLCDLGVCLGATLIFVLVRVLHFRSEGYEKRRGVLDRISSGMHTRSVVLILYLLFLTPVIPFGAICYYGSSTRIRYGRYLLTVATGVVPSIVVSNLIGAAGRAFFVNRLPIWLLLLIIVVLAAALFAAVFLIMDRVCFRENDRTPDSPVYALLMFVTALWAGRRFRLRIEDEALRGLSAPYVLLCNHESFFDFHYISRMAHPRNPSFLVNEFYTTRPVLRTLAEKGGILSKKLFTPDLGAAAGILRMLRRGYPVVIFPEGRLSPDGRSNPIAEPGGRFYKKLDADLVLVRIRGAYYANPKWRPFRCRTDVTVRVERVLRAAELREMDADALDALIAETLYTDERGGTRTPIRRGNRAKGLENLLYRCCDCGALYTVRSRGNSLRCTACGSVHTLDAHYRFTDGPASIGDWYDLIRERERAELDRLELRCAVRTKIYGRSGGPVRREEGECSLTGAAFRYRSAAEDFTIPTEQLPALAFSCGTEFELYHDGELHYFYPADCPQQAARWALAVDLLAEQRKEEPSHV